MNVGFKNGETFGSLQANNEFTIFSCSLSVRYVPVFTAKLCERDFAITTLFLNCGMRLSELVNINIKDIKFDEYKMTVIGKGNKERTIYLNKACIDALKKYLAVRPNNAKKDSKNSDKALFLSSYRQRISKRTVENVVSRELQKAGLDTTKYSTHKLRHTAATLMYQYGQVDIRALQELLGHQSKKSC